MTVYGRGELHIAILVENMRREGYELQSFSTKGNIERCKEAKE